MNSNYMPGIFKDIISLNSQDESLENIKPILHRIYTVRD